MAEPFGIAAGAVGIAALFTTCVDCFNYVQAGRSFGKDYQTNVLALNLSQLRLARWGTAVNIYTDSQLGNPTATKAELQTAKNALMQILMLFAESEKIAKKFKMTGEAGALAEYEPVDADVSLTALTNNMRDLAVKRQKGTSLLKVTKWSLHHGEAFTRLLAQITQLVDGVETLFPAPAKQKLLAQEEVATVKDRQDLLMLEKAADSVDPLMKSTATQALQGHLYKNVHAKDQAKVFDGDSIGNDWKGPLPQGPSHTYDGVWVEGNAKVQNGNRYGGKDFFDD